MSWDHALDSSVEPERQAAEPAAQARPKTRQGRRLPIRSRANGMAVAALGLAVLGALGLPLAERLDPAPFAQAGQVADSGRFEVWFGGLPVGEVDFSISVDERSYSAHALALPAKALSRLFGAKLEARGEGEADPRLPRPTHFELAARFAGDAQRVEVRYAPPGRPAEVLAEPEWKTREWEIDPVAQMGTTDPFGAAALFLTPVAPEALCNGAVEVFDGRRRSRIELDAPSARGEGWKCEGRWTRVAGFRPKDLAKAPTPLSVEFDPTPDGKARVVRMQAETAYGLAIASRVMTN